MAAGGLPQVRDRREDEGDAGERGGLEERNLTLTDLGTLMDRFPVTIGPFDQWRTGIYLDFRGLYAMNNVTRTIF